MEKTNMSKQLKQKALELAGGVNSNSLELALLLLVNTCKLSTKEAVGFIVDSLSVDITNMWGYLHGDTLRLGKYKYMVCFTRSGFSAKQSNIYRIEQKGIIQEHKTIHSWKPKEDKKKDMAYILPIIKQDILGLISSGVVIC